MVATVTSLQTPDQELQRMQQLFSGQQQAYRQHPLPTAAERIRDLKRLKQALLTYRDELASAVNQDFSCRSKDETDIAEIMTCAQGIDYSVKHLKRWMKPSRRHVSMLFAPSHNHVMYQPLGVIGIMVPWNYPIQLAVLPLATALSAGNRAMIKMSEFTPATNKVLHKMLADVFSEEQVAVVEGEVEVSSAFAELPWDHLIFTGSTAVGKIVMGAAAKNLTPVTLELGGKSPAIIAPGTSMKDAVERICFGKSLNAGQTCIAPDYVLLPAGKEQEFIDTYQQTFARMYPTLRDNSDYTAIVNARQFDRLQSWLRDAEEKGARIVAINPANEDFSSSGKMPMTMVFDTTEDMLIEQNEIFGPLLIVKAYDNLEQAVQYINDRPRPLALYYFDYNQERADYVMTHTHAGGGCINDTLSHVAVEDIPFGGIGPSGMGHYHGYEGFLTFSKSKGIVQKGKINPAKLLFPPWNRRIHKMVLKMAFKPD